MLHKGTTVIYTDREENFRSISFILSIFENNDILSHRDVSCKKVPERIGETYKRYLPRHFVICLQMPYCRKEKTSDQTTRI